ncbi:MAG: hypothetical protein CMJ24_01180 [Phycisphaerae bacterium]|nr:hypothetical protein [Phycisphaerae bacterium]
MSGSGETIENAMQRNAGGYTSRRAMKEAEGWPPCPPEIMEAWRVRLEEERPDDPEYVQMVLNQVEVYWDF